MNDVNNNQISKEIWEHIKTYPLSVWEPQYGDFSLARFRLVVRSGVEVFLRQIFSGDQYCCSISYCLEIPSLGVKTSGYDRNSFWAKVFRDWPDHEDFSTLYYRLRSYHHAKKTEERLLKEAASKRRSVEEERKARHEVKVREKLDEFFGRS